MKKDAPYYIQQGLKKFQGLFQKKEQVQEHPVIDEPEQTEEAPGTTGTPDYTEWQQSIRDGILKQLPAIVRHEINYPSKNLLVIINNDNLFEEARANSFESYLNEWIEYNKEHTFASIILQQGCPPTSLLRTQVDKWTTIAVENKAATEQKKQVESTPEQPVKAVLTVLDGCCTFPDGKVELTGTKVETWNLGFGKFNNINGRLARNNQIALVYADPTGRENDDYPVSRAHAHITFRPGKGFMFYVDPRGIDKRTIIQKGEKQYPVNNTKSGWLLEDNDKIILNNEILLFNLITN